MTDPIVRIDEGADASVAWGWDSVWQNFTSALGGCADYVIADDTEPLSNRGGLKAQDALGTAILLCLFTDLRRPDDLEAPDGSDDRRGWHGDTFDLDASAGEVPMGSLLWTLERAAINFETLKMAEHYAAEALQTLVKQGAVHHFEIMADADRLQGMIKLYIQAFAPSGAPVFADTFALQ